MENEFYPPARIIEVGHRLAEAGADIILGHHPHVIGPLERYIPKGRTQGLPEVLIAYSLGNFIPDSYKVTGQTGIILHVSLARGSVNGKDTIWIEDVDYTPVLWYCRRLSGRRDYRLINIDQALAPEGRQHYPFLRSRNWRELEAAQGLILQYLGPLKK
jgi:poly-gamma-glutamate synthesis protein (capsule biosynthesis protein)